MKLSGSSSWPGPCSWSPWTLTPSTTQPSSRKHRWLPSLFTSRSRLPRWVQETGSYGGLVLQGLFWRWGAWALMGCPSLSFLLCKTHGFGTIQPNMDGKSRVHCAFCVFNIINVIKVTQVSLISKLLVHHWVRKMKEPGMVCSSVIQLWGGWKVLDLVTSGCTKLFIWTLIQGSGRDAT